MSQQRQIEATHHNPEAHLNDSMLVRNVMHNLKGKKGDVLWGRVTQVFAIGSGSAFALCRRFNFNPEAAWVSGRWKDKELTDENHA